MFREQLNVSTCEHKHESYTAPGEFVAILAANPFRRVVSSAAWHSAISGGRRPFPSTWSLEEESRRFRDFCHNNSTQWTAIKGATDMLRNRTADFVAFTATLEADMVRLLARLGYPPVRIAKHHCVSSCQTTSRVVDSLPTARYDQRQLFDQKCADTIRERFDADFRSFHFSLRVEDMLNTSLIA